MMLHLQSGFDRAIRSASGETRKHMEGRKINVYVISVGVLSFTVQLMNG